MAGHYCTASDSRAAQKSLVSTATEILVFSVLCIVSGVDRRNTKVRVYSYP
jgi:hypothetical protein